MPDGQLIATFRAGFVQHHRGGHRTSLGDLPGVFAIRIAGTGEELAEPTPLEDHRTATLLTGLVGVGILRHGLGADLTGGEGGLRAGDVAGRFALWIVGAGKELAKASELDGHLRSTLFTALVGDDLLSFDVTHVLFRRLQIDGELGVEASQGSGPLDLALFDLVELLLHPGGIFDVEEVGKAFDKEVVDDDAQFRWVEATFEPLDVLPFLDHRHDRGIGRGATDPLLLEGLDEGRLGEARGRFGEVLVGCQGAEGQSFPFGDPGQLRRPLVVLLVLFVFPLFIDREKTVELDH